MCGCMWRCREGPWLLSDDSQQVGDPGPLHSSSVPMAGLQRMLLRASDSLYPFPTGLRSCVSLESPNLHPDHTLSPWNSLPKSQEPFQDPHKPGPLWDPNTNVCTLGPRVAFCSREQSLDLCARQASRVEAVGWGGLQGKPVSLHCSSVSEALVRTCLSW